MIELLCHIDISYNIIIILYFILLFFTYFIYKYFTYKEFKPLIKTIKYIILYNKYYKFLKSLDFSLEDYNVTKEI